MQVPSSLLPELYNEVKYWLPAITLVWGVYGIVHWFKSIKNNDLHHIQLSINEFNQKLDTQTVVLKDEINKQTSSIVGELKELRQDFREGYGKRLTI